METRQNILNFMWAVRMSEVSTARECLKSPSFQNACALLHQVHAENSPPSDPLAITQVVQADMISLVPRAFAHSLYRIASSSYRNQLWKRLTPDPYLMRNDLIIVAASRGDVKSNGHFSRYLFPKLLKKTTAFSDSEFADFMGIIISSYYVLYDVAQYFEEQEKYLEAERYYQLALLGVEMSGCLPAAAILESLRALYHKLGDTRSAGEVEFINTWGSNEGSVDSTKWRSRIVELRDRARSHFYSFSNLTDTWEKRKGHFNRFRREVVSLKKDLSEDPVLNQLGSEKTPAILKDLDTLYQAVCLIDQVLAEHIQRVEGHIPYLWKPALSDLKNLWGALNSKVVSLLKSIDLIPLTPQIREEFIICLRDFEIIDYWLREYYPLGSIVPEDILSIKAALIDLTRKTWDEFMTAISRKFRK
ncbi:MAG: hypothetical protein IPJ69_02565 [Deltaproteobacteria bacterium]|nr:MAG: hypothetical protein IPJ69_02565 [Deltaproteobacteria bacterium]